MPAPHLSIAAESYPGSDPYLEALHDLLAPRFADWSIGIEIDIPPFSTWKRLLRTCEKCQALGVRFYLDDLCMMADLVEFERRRPTQEQLDRLLDLCPNTFLGIRLHTVSETHEVTPNHYADFLKWNARNQREVQLVVEAATWPGSDWERTTSVHPEQPWTVLAHVHPTADGVAGCSQVVRRLPENGKRGYSLHLDHPEPCNAMFLEECVVACLENAPACLALRPLNWLVDNPGSAKLPDDLHTWPLFNMVDALRPKRGLVLTQCGTTLAATFAEG